jgi:lambda repressor-like predicted transcriptional regulator
VKFTRRRRLPCNLQRLSKTALAVACQSEPIWNVVSRKHNEDLRWRGGKKALAINNGYHATAAGKALKRPWPAMQKIIAEAIGVPPETIWPSRYVGGHHHVVRVMKRATPRADRR